MRTLVLGLALASLMTYAQPVSKAFDPVGKWTYSTKDDAGAPISGTMEITGTPGKYAGPSSAARIARSQSVRS